MNETLAEKINRIAEQTAGALTTLEHTPQVGDELLPPWMEATDWVARYDVRSVENGVITVQARSLNADTATYPVPTTIPPGERWRYYSRKDGGTPLKS